MFVFLCNFQYLMKSINVKYGSELKEGFPTKEVQNYLG